MVNYLEILSSWMDQPHYLLIVLIVLYALSATIDFLLGIINATASENQVFSSRKAQIGIIRKLVTLLLMVMVVPLALIFPMDVGIYSLTILYIGIVVSEIYSILGHIGIVKDGDKHKNIVGSLFEEFLDRITGKTKEKEKNV